MPRVGLQNQREARPPGRKLRKINRIFKIKFMAKLAESKGDHLRPGVTRKVSPERPAGLKLGVLGTAEPLGSPWTMTSKSGARLEAPGGDSPRCIRKNTHQRN